MKEKKTSHQKFSTQEQIDMLFALVEDVLLENETTNIVLFRKLAARVGRLECGRKKMRPAKLEPWLAAWLNNSARN